MPGNLTETSLSEQAKLTWNAGFSSCCSGQITLKWMIGESSFDNSVQRARQAQSEIRALPRVPKSAANSNPTSTAPCYSLTCLLPGPTQAIYCSWRIGIGVLLITAVHEAAAPFSIHNICLLVAWTQRTRSEGLTLHERLTISMTESGMHLRQSQSATPFCLALYPSGDQAFIKSTDYSINQVQMFTLRIQLQTTGNILCLRCRVLRQAVH
jgi:hypothetical protein